MNYDIIIVGAGFSGLTLASKLPHNLRVLVIEKKRALDALANTTGLITVATKNLIGNLVDVDRYLTNQIDDICVIDPSFERHFISSTDFPWIFSTNTPELLAAIGRTCGDNVEFWTETALVSWAVDPDSTFPVRAICERNGEKVEVCGRFIAGADGTRSTVAQGNAGLARQVLPGDASPRSALPRNRRLLFAYEKVYAGDLLLGDRPDKTVYHLWFGSFSLGYGGWIAPNFLGGRKVFRIGLAAYHPDASKARKLDELVGILLDRGILRLDGDRDAAFLAGYGGYIPVGGVLRRPYNDYSLLTGDAAGFCGAFSADGIKGAVLSGMIAAELIPDHLDGDRGALARYHAEMERRGRMISYYRKQRRYRFLWDRIKSNASFTSLFRLCERERAGFLNQFCDAKDKQASLLRVVVRARNLPQLVAMAANVAIDTLTNRR